MKLTAKLRDSVLDSAGEGIYTVDLQGRATFVNSKAASLLGYEPVELLGKNVHSLVHHTTRGGQPYPETECPIVATLRDGLAHHSDDQSLWARDGSEIPVEYNSTPLRDDSGKIMGAVVVFQDITARMKAMAHIRRQFEQLTALRAIDVAILTSQDLRLTLNIVLDETLVAVGGDAAAIFLFDSTTQALAYAASRGFSSNRIAGIRHDVEEGRAGRIALEGRALLGVDLTVSEVASEASDLIAAEGFREYNGVPLIARGHVIGVLEIYYLRRVPWSEDYVANLEALAGQAAIAIDSRRLFDDLRNANRELTTSYDAMIEGWARALEQRDGETLGHSLRVTEMTLRLARVLGVGAEDEDNMRRGALLHDVGKMGVPDSILLKPGPLTEEEWAVMRRHPEDAYEMLYRIPFLRPALDIPLCHHEKWDGSGYPNGLKGENIPLAARIFAVVDVWDALRTDRPYRGAWSDDRVYEHLRKGAGAHFDPVIVKAFLGLHF